MNFNTKQKMTKFTITKIPITDNVIKRVKKMADKQGITEIKFYNKNTTLNFPNIDWEQSVDYDSEKNEIISTYQMMTYNMNAKYHRMKLTNY